MRVLAGVRRVAALAGVASLAVAGLVVLTAAAGSGSTAVTALMTTSGPSNHSNVGATHSPQVLHELARPSATAGVSSRLMGPSAITGAITGAVQGVDVASFQHPKTTQYPAGAPINWADVAADGIQFAAVKATEGAYYQNPFALTDLAQAKAAGLSVVAYAFAIPNGSSDSSSSPVTQADYLLTDLGTASSTVPIMLDMEYDPNSDGTNECYGLSQPAMVSWISAFSAEIRSKTGQLPIIYTPPVWWQTCTGGSTASGQTPLWVPDFSSAASPSLPTGWGNWSFWQYTSTGTVSGIDYPSVDLDQLNPALIPILDPGNQQTVAGSPVDWQLKQADPIAGQVPSYSATGAPAGVSVRAGGLTVGWPDQPGTYPVKVTATGQSATGSVAFTWTVQPAPNAGPAGPVRLDLGGKCLTTVGASSANGTRADIWTCTGGAAQHWTVAADDTLRVSGKCLNVYRAGTTTGTPVNLYICNGGKAQQWRLGTGGQLINPRSGKCLSDATGSTANGTRVVLAPCTGTPSRKWTLPAGPVASQIPGKCMNDAGNSSANSTPVNLGACSGTAAQAWTANPDDTVRIHGKCLDTYRAGQASGTPVELYTCNATAAEHWSVVADGAGISLVNSASGLCLADPGDSTTNGTQLRIVTCAPSDPGMVWRIR